MKFAIPRILIVAAIGVIAAASAEEPKCHAPIAECDRQIRQMLSGRRYLGIQINDLRPGVKVTAVLPDSPAWRAGVAKDDRLVSINGKSVLKASAGDVKALIADARSTGTVWLIVQRRGAFKKIEARLEPYPKEYVEKVVANHVSQSHTSTAGAQP